MTTTANPIVTWKIDPAHSSAEFKVKHMMISSVKGSFNGLNGTLIEDTSNPTLSHVDATIDISTISTGDAQRDGHLKSVDSLHHEQHPNMTFHSTLVEKKGDGEYAVTGDLTIHGAAKPVVFAVEGPSTPGKDHWGNTRIGLRNHKDQSQGFRLNLECGA